MGKRPPQGRNSRRGAVASRRFQSTVSSSDSSTVGGSPDLKPVQPRRVAAGMFEGRAVAVTVSAAATVERAATPDSDAPWSPARKVLAGYVPRNAAASPPVASSVAFAMSAAERGDTWSSSSASPSAATAASTTDSFDDDERESWSSWTKAAVGTPGTPRRSGHGPSDAPRLAAVQGYIPPHCRTSTMYKYAGSPSPSTSSSATEDYEVARAKVFQGVSLRLPRASESGAAPRLSRSLLQRHTEEEHRHFRSPAAAMRSSLSRSSSASSDSARGAASVARLMALRRLIPADANQAAAAAASESPTRATGPRPRRTAERPEFATAGGDDDDQVLKASRREGVSPLAVAAGRSSGSADGQHGILLSPKSTGRRSSQHHVHFAADADASSASPPEDAGAKYDASPIGTALIITDSAPEVPSTTAAARPSMLSAFEAAYRLEQEEQRMAYDARQQRNTASSGGTLDDVVVSARSTMTMPSARSSFAGPALEPSSEVELTAWLRVEGDTLDRLVNEEVAAHTAWAQEVEEQIAALDKEAADIADLLQSNRRHGQAVTHHLSRARLVCQKMAASGPPDSAATPRR